MKKKVALFITLLVSLFIYSERVEAVVMWLQCTDDDTAEMEVIIASDMYKFKHYNTIAVINEYDSSTSTKRVFYAGGSDSKKGTGVQKNFFNYLGPTFFVPIGGSNAAGIKYSQNLCWYPTDNIYNGICGESGISFINAEDAFNSGMCPKKIAQNTSTEDGNAGGIEGDYAVMSGTENAKGVEELKGAQFVLYNISIGEDFNAWIMETYNSSGVYGYTVIIPTSIFENNAGFYWQDVVNTILQITGVSGDHDDIMDDEYDYASEVDWIQHTQLIRLHQLGRDYFKLSLSKNDLNSPVLLANISENNDLKVEKVYTFDYNAKETWNFVNEWYNSFTKNGVDELSILLNKFNDNGDYGKLLKKATEVNDALASGTKYNLDVNNLQNNFFQDSINELNAAYSDLNKLLEDVSFPNYKKASFSDKITGTVTGNRINNCIVDGTKESALDSLTDYVSCNTFGYLFTDIAGQSLKSPISSGEIAGNNNVMKRGVVAIGNNTKIVESAFASVMNEQLNMAIGSGDVDFLNYKNNAKNYIILLSRYASYLKQNYSEFLTEQQVEDLNNVVNKYLKLARDKYDIEIVLDCGTLLGEDFIKKLGKYINIIKIAIPIILIGFGILDFTKAFFAADDAKMKAAQKKFLMRIIIAVLFFLLPIFLRLILSIANKAWNFITPNSCNIEW